MAESALKETSQPYDLEFEKSFAWFWVKMNGAYQGKWVKYNGELDPENSEVVRWKKTLSTLTHQQIKAAINQLEARRDAWPPNRIEFIQLAKQIGYPAHRTYLAPKQIAQGTEADRMAAGARGFAEARNRLGMKQRDSK